MRRLADLQFTPLATSGGPDDDRKARRDATRLVLLFAACTFFLASAIAFTHPLLRYADERVHLAYVDVVLSGSLPEIDDEIPRGGRFPVIDQSTLERLGPNPDPADPGNQVWVANHPPLLYVLAAGPTAGLAALGIDAGPPMFMRLLNAAGFALGVLAVAAVADGLFPGRRRLAVTAAGLAALTPQVVGIAAIGVSDGIAFATATGLLAVGLRTLRTGPSTQKLLVLAGLGAAAALSRGALLPLIPLMAVAWLAAAWPRERWRALLGSAVVVAVPALLSGWFYLRNLELYGSLTAASDLQRQFGRAQQGSTLDILFRPRVGLGLWQGMWAGFDNNVTLGSGRRFVGRAEADLGTSLVIGLVVGLAAALGWLRQAWTWGLAGARSLRTTLRQHSRGAVVWALSLAGLAITIVGVASFVSGGGSPNPRYLFPAHAVTVTLLVAGLIWLAPRARLELVLLGGLAAINLYLLTEVADIARHTPFTTGLEQKAGSEVVAWVAVAGAVVCVGLALRGLWRMDPDPAG